MKYIPANCKGKIIFLGIRRLGFWTLQKLVEMGYDILAVVTEDYRISDGYESEDFLDICKKNNIRYFKGEDYFKNPEFINLIDSKRPDLIISYWKRLIPEFIINGAKYGGINIHHAFLPKYRRFAPLNWTLINGDTKAGTTLHYIDKYADTGDIIAQRCFSIRADDDIGSLQLKADQIALKLIEKYLPNIFAGKAPRIRQKQKGAMLSCMRLEIMGEILWNQPALKIYNFIRALTKPYPGAYTRYKDKKLIIWKARLPRKSPSFIGHIGQVSMVDKEGVWILCQDSAIILTEVQLGNGKPNSANKVIKSLKEILGKLPTPVVVIKEKRKI